MPVDGPSCRDRAASKLAREPTTAGPQARPAQPLQSRFREEVRPACHKTPILGHFSCAGRTFSRLHDDYRTFSCTAAGEGDAGRKTSRTGLRNTAALKPTTPLHTHNKGPLKPTSPMHPKTAPKTPISHPQRRWRFQSHTDTSEQRRQGFQTTGPPGRQGLAAVPVGGGGA